MADDDHRPLERLQRLLQRVARPHVEVVRRLVEDQHVDALRHQPGQRRPAALAAGELADLLIDLLAVEPEAAEQVAHRLLGRRPGRRPARRRG